MMKTKRVVFVFMAFIFGGVSFLLVCIARQLEEVPVVVKWIVGDAAYSEMSCVPSIFLGILWVVFGAFVRSGVGDPIRNALVSGCGSGLSLAVMAGASAQLGAIALVGPLWLAAIVLED